MQTIKFKWYIWSKLLMWQMQSGTLFCYVTYWGSIPTHVIHLWFFFHTTLEKNWVYRANTHQCKGKAKSNILFIYSNQKIGIKSKSYKTSCSAETWAASKSLSRISMRIWCALTKSKADSSRDSSIPSSSWVLCISRTISTEKNNEKMQQNYLCVL